MVDAQNSIVVPVILCGGVGSRLWPVSRDTHPKPFIKLDDGLSLFQRALSRGLAVAYRAEPVVVTNQALRFKLEDECKALVEYQQGEHSAHYILEPFGRNTAPAIALAAQSVRHHYGRDAVMMVMAADHVIQPLEAFKRSVERAVTLATDGHVVTFGIQPNRAEIGYGYIEADGEAVQQFVEKPDLKTAEAYLASGRFLWNSGMFCFQAGTVLDELERYSPKISQAIEHCVDEQRLSEPFLELDADRFEQVPDDSFDYAIMERTGKAKVVACSFDWNDVGCWRSLSGVEQADVNGNRFSGQVIDHDVSNTVVKSERVVGVVGVSDLIIVDTPDALLIAKQNASQQVKHIYQALKKEAHSTCIEHTTVARPWGTYTVLEEGQFHKIKRIVVKPKAKLSLQSHEHRSEHWVVVQGQATVTNGDEIMQLNVNESTYIAAGHKHRLENNTDAPVHIIEVQTGHYLGEDDITRYDDVYQRS